ncbi:hypothetical protein [Methylobacter sp. BBA5.1]|jgi:hypothetical protein|uniref:hypothetical protein n=1 Tax=Methylobacter sp. BBA5.1 TaxID=1495064 RepID=UPI000A59029F|nr:hypothetical protein [Methylobacter sp. BBA5.1]
MNTHRIIIFQLTGLFIVASSLSLNAQATSIPFAETSSDLVITVSIPDSVPLYSLANASSETYTRAVSTSTGQQTSPTMHSAIASAMVQIPNDGETTATFHNTFHTASGAFSAEPLFSKGAAIGHGSVVNLTNTTSSFLNLNWDFTKFNLKTEPVSAFAYISDTINITQLSASGLRTTSSYGFFTFVENGKHTTEFLGDFNVADSLRNWFDDNIMHFQNQLMLKEDAQALNVDIPLLTHNGLVVLGIDNTHTEISYEAPPAAAYQVEDKIGHFAPDSKSGQVHWDADRKILSFDDLSINTLTNEFNQHYENDPLNGGMLEIDPLQLITSYDGREYFAGKELRLVDKNGNVLYRASLPNLVFDDRLFESQGFNMFAPILNILEADGNNSNWLRDYLSKTGLDSLLLPELFIGFDPVDNAGNIWKHNFNAAAKTILSFGGAPLKVPTAVPLPNSFILFALGLAGLSIIGQSRKRKFSYSVSIS